MSGRGAWYRRALIRGHHDRRLAQNRCRTHLPETAPLAGIDSPGFHRHSEPERAVNLPHRYGFRLSQAPGIYVKMFARGLDDLSRHPADVAPHLRPGNRSLRPTLFVGNPLCGLRPATEL